VRGTEVGEGRREATERKERDLILRGMERSEGKGREGKRQGR